MCVVYYKLLFDLFLGIMALTVGVCKKSTRKCRAGRKGCSLVGDC